MVSYLEFLAYTGITSEDEILFADFCDRIDIIGLSIDELELLNETTRLRREYHLKLPDAIIAATALTKVATLVTADKDFRKLNELKIINPVG